MSNDPLARSDIWTGAPNDTEYDAVYAAVTATERGRWFLTEYAYRNRHADTDTLVAAMARIEAGMAANKTAPFDLAAAAERVQDIAFGLRERGVDSALCDALDAAAREICEALANGKPAAVDVVASAAELIESAPAAANENDNGIEDAAGDDLSRGNFFKMEAEENKKFTEAVTALAVSLTSPSEEAASLAELQNPPADAVVPPPDYAHVSALPPPQQTESARLWHIEAPDFVFDRPGREARDNHVEAEDQPSQAHPLLAGAQLQLGPDEDPDNLFEPSPNGVVIPLASTPASATATPEPAVMPKPAVIPEPVATFEPMPTTSAAVAPVGEMTPLLRIANGSPPEVNSRPAPRDPLADIRGLSEEELIALFG